VAVITQQHLTKGPPMHRSQFVQDQNSGGGKAYDEMMKLSIRCLGAIVAVLLGLGFLAIPAAAHPPRIRLPARNMLVTLDDEKVSAGTCDRAMPLPSVPR
jgi:hypothetical protein